MSKFGNLGLNVAKPYRMKIIYPGQTEPLKDLDGNEAYLDLLSTDSKPARDFDAETQRTANNLIAHGALDAAANDDGQIRARRRQAALTVGWHLVDPITREPLKIDCTPESAFELYNEPELGWLYKKAVVASASEANFSKRLSLN